MHLRYRPLTYQYDDLVEALTPSHLSYRKKIILSSRAGKKYEKRVLEEKSERGAD